MTERRPWWYSGGDDVPEPEPAEGTPTDGTPAGAVDWAVVVTGAQRLVDWAADRVIAPHSGHGDPRDHPDCLVCRAMTALGPGSDAAQRPPVRADEITWVPIVDVRAADRP